MENRLEHLNQVNDVPVHSVLDPEFASYGRVVTGYDFSEMIAYMEQNTPIPENGNVYVASVPEMEALAVSAEVQKKFYGDMPVEVGYCNGRNTTWNGFEYHKGSEINVAVTDFMLILGHDRPADGLRGHGCCYRRHPLLLWFCNSEIRHRHAACHDRPHRADPGGAETA